MSEWKTIDSAPKDGTFVLLAKAGGNKVYIGAWLMDWESTEMAWRPDQHKSYRGATHWMPLPSPPVSP